MTSTAALEILKEKERKKQEEVEMKDKKKKEREKTKKRKEEEKRKKAEERAKKQELKAKVRAEQEVKRRKEKQPVSVGTKRGQVTRSTRPSKSPWTVVNLSNEINDSECCVCYVAYHNDQSGKDWVACACGPWLHEDCADDCHR